MEDQERTNEQLVRELERLRQRIAALVTLADETKQADAALQGSLTFSQALIEANPEAMVVIDRDYRIVLANRAAREMAGEEDPASKCLTCYQVFHGGTTPCEELGDWCPLVQITETKARRLSHTPTMALMVTRSSLKSERPRSLMHQARSFKSSRPAVTSRPASRQRMF